MIRPTSLIIINQYPPLQCSVCLCCRRDGRVKSFPGLWTRYSRVCCKPHHIAGPWSWHWASHRWEFTCTCTWQRFFTFHDLLPHTIWSHWNNSDLCGMGWTCTYLTTRALLKQCRVKHIKVPIIKVTSSRRRWWIPKGESPDPSLLQQLRATFRTGWNWDWCCKKIKSTNDIVSLWRIISKLLIMIEDL